jgi:hypothetical protein
MRSGAIPPPPVRPARAMLLSLFETYTKARHEGKTRNASPDKLVGGPLLDDCHLALLLLLLDGADDGALLLLLFKGLTSEQHHSHHNS